MSKIEKYVIGVAKDSMEFNFNCCMEPKQAVHAVFGKYLQRVHSSELMDCILAIQVFKTNPTMDATVDIIKTYLETNSRCQVNVEESVRLGYIQRVTNSTGIEANVFHGFEEILLLQLRDGSYDSFISSMEFKVWISSRYQSELMDSMAMFLTDFGREEERKNACLSCYF
jgi:hypothetical protein